MSLMAIVSLSLCTFGSCVHVLYVHIDKKGLEFRSIEADWVVNVKAVSVCLLGFYAIG